LLSLTALPLLLLLLLAGAAFLAGASSRSLFPNPGLVASWTVRLGLLLALAVAVAILVQIQPTGTVEVTLWRIESHLPVTLAVGVGGLGIAMVAMVAALVVSFAAADRRPLVSAALGLAALGSVMAALSGDLLSLFVGLQLSAAGGIGISYARSPRAASHRIVWAAVADQTVALIWLGAVVALYHSAGTLQFSDIPTSSVNYVLAAILLVPALVRLGSAALLMAAPSTRPGGRALDVADWLVVAAVPTALVILLRDLQLSGGVWPAASFGTILDTLGLGLALGVGLWLVLARQRSAGLGALLLAAVALTLLGFGSDSPSGVELGVGSALFLEFLAGFLPRVLGPPGDARSAAGEQGWATALMRMGVLAAGSPFSLGFTAAALGLLLGLRTGGGAGLMPTVGYAACLLLLCLLSPSFLRLRPAGFSWRLWFLTVPGGFLVVGAIAGGWALTGLASAIAFSGATVPVAVTAPDPLLLQLPGILYPQGYLALLALLLLIGASALRYAAGLPLSPSRPTFAAGAADAPRRELGRAVDLSGLESAARWALRSVTTGLEMSERELAERPVWLWLSTAAAMAWLMAQR
jgi:hypothetical protein